jgi:hypothetical protein
MGINPITNGPHVHVMLLDFKPDNFFWIDTIRFEFMTFAP